jgi:hypothetical protein
VPLRRRRRSVPERHLADEHLRGTRHGAEEQRCRLRWPPRCLVCVAKLWRSSVMPRSRCPDEGAHLPVAHFTLDAATERIGWSDCPGHAIQPPEIGCGPLAGPFGFLGFWVSQAPCANRRVSWRHWAAWRTKSSRSKRKTAGNQPTAAIGASDPEALLSLLSAARRPVALVIQGHPAPGC